jgi:E3 ubiquitin-protein ligase synoviolin
MKQILFNLLLLITYGLMRGLQKVIYGPLRAIEREQLWDKAWYAVTETALAMTTFRDEVGTWFFVMFVGLLAGKVWQWISEARVEALEQQPPTNPRLFHARLITSLVISEAFDILMLRYCVNTLLEQPRPGMMVMFAFEFAVLAISSTSTAAKYTLSLVENSVVKKQTKARVEERREEIRLSREQAAQPAEDGTTDTATANAGADAGAEEDIDEDDIDVPGWQEKGRWLLFLDLLTGMLQSDVD